MGMEKPFEPVKMQGISRSGKSLISRAVETIYLHHVSVMQVLSMNQETTPFRAWQFTWVMPGGSDH